MAEEPVTQATEPPQQTATTTTTEKPAATTSTEGKQNGGEPARHAATLLSAKSDAPEATTPKTGAPDQYGDFKYPDGMQGYQGDQLKAVHDMFREAGVSQEHAQKLVDFHGQELAKVANSHTDGWNAVNKQWMDELKADKSIGSGTDSILKPEVSSAIAKLVDGHLGGDKFRAAMEQTGAGNHPDVVRGLYKIAQKMNEGTAVEGNPGTQQPRRSIAQRMYPSLVAKET